MAARGGAVEIPRRVGPGVKKLVTICSVALSSEGAREKKKKRRREEGPGTFEAGRTSGILISK